MRRMVYHGYRKILLPLFLGSWMVSCSPLNPLGWAQDYVDIAKLNEITNQRTVNLQGIVVNVAPFLEGGAYQIQDKTGKVWVKTSGPLPKKGTVVTVKGEVAYEAIFVGSEKLGESYVLDGSVPRPAETATNSNPPAPTDNAAALVTPSPTPPSPATPSPPVTVSPSPTPAVSALSPSPVPATPSPTPSPQASPAQAQAIQAIEVVNTPETSTSTAKPSPKPAPKPGTKTRLNVDDQFLPHKQLKK